MDTGIKSQIFVIMNETCVCFIQYIYPIPITPEGVGIQQTSGKSRNTPGHHYMTGYAAFSRNVGLS